MPLPNYSTGTVSVAANGTVVTGIGPLWFTNAHAGDTLLLAGREVTIQEVTDETHLVIDPWPGSTLAGSTYKIIFNNPQRVVGAQGRAAVDRLVAALETDGFYIFVKSSLTDPDPSLGNDGQYAFQPSTGKLWVKTAGAWSFLGIYKGFGFKGTWSSVTAYTVNDVVSYNGGSYISILASLNQAPPNATYWALLASKGDTGLIGPAGPSYAATSTTSLTIGAGSKVFTTQAGLAYTNGARVRASSAANTSNWMEGVASYSGTTMTMAVDKTNGSGTLADWNFNLAGQPGAAGGMVGPSSAVDSDQVVFDGITGNITRSGGAIDPVQRVNPVPIDMHFGTLAGIGWSASEPGGIVNTTTTAASSTNVIVVVSATGFYVGQLICYVATDGFYYPVVIQTISGTTCTLDRGVLIASGGNVYNFYNNNAHPNVHGFACLVDDAIRRTTTVKELVYVGTNPAQWSADGAATLTNETTSSYQFPGSTVATERAVRVTGSATNVGAVSAPVALDGGTYETQVIVNPGNRTGGFSGSITLTVTATYEDGTSSNLATFSSAGFGNSILAPVLKYRVPKSAKIQVYVRTPNGGPWTFWVGMIRHHKVTGLLRDLNRGRHVVFGDSWAAGGDFVTRLTARLSRATVINKGFSGDTSTTALARFDADMAGTNPTFVWVILGTNDAYANVTPTAFQTNIDEIIRRIQALGAVPLVFNTSVCDLSYVPAPGPRLDQSRQLAIRSFLADCINPLPLEGATTPALSAATGTITTSSCALSYTKTGTRVEWEAVIAITTAGTGAGELIIPLPFAPIADGFCAGINASLTIGVQGRLLAPTPAARVSKYDGTTTVLSGNNIRVGGSYKTAF